MVIQTVKEGFAWVAAASVFDEEHRRIAGWRHGDQEAMDECRGLVGAVGIGDLPCPGVNHLPILAVSSMAHLSKDGPTALGASDLLSQRFTRLVSGR